MIQTCVCWSPCTNDSFVEDYVHLSHICLKRAVTRISMCTCTCAANSQNYIPYLHTVTIYLSFLNTRDRHIYYTYSAFHQRPDGDNSPGE